MRAVLIPGVKCERCAYAWVPRSMDALPRTCPSCRSAYWNTPRRKKRRKDGDERVEAGRAGGREGVK